MQQDLRPRTRAFALRIIRLFQALPKSGEAKIIGNQLLRSGTSVGAQIAEANRAKSKADLRSKIDGAAQELEETQYWIDLLIEIKIFPLTRYSALQKEISELLAIFVTLSKKLQE